MKTALNKSIENENNFQTLGNKENKLFSTMKDVYILATIIGFQRNKRIPFDKSGGEAIKLSLLNSDDKNIIDSIALDETNDITILLEENTDKKLEIIEEYANGGMEVLYESLLKPIPSFNKLEKFVLDYRKDNIPKREIEDLLEDAFKDI